VAPEPPQAPVTRLAETSRDRMIGEPSASGTDWRTALTEAGMGKGTRDVAKSPSASPSASPATSPAAQVPAAAPATPAAPSKPAVPAAPAAAMTPPPAPVASDAPAAPKTGRYSLLPDAPGAEAPGAASVAGARANTAPRSKGAAPWSSIDLSRYPDGLVTGRAHDEATDGPLAGVANLAEIAHRIAGCTQCGLHATARNPVPGAGNPNADFVVVGEAPGETEDETGLPFVGASGKLLTDILAAIELTRDNVFICNVIKHRPPGNRNPAPEEIAACGPYLVRQIELIKPKVIMAFGTFAAQTLLRTTTPIGKLRGQVHRYHGVPLIVTYHPAALLRNPAWKRPTWEDVQLARRILDRATTGA
jgi:uracil-DNA glycosylase family 4